MTPLLKRGHVARGLPPWSHEGSRPGHTRAPALVRVLQTSEILLLLLLFQRFILFRFMALFRKEPHDQDHQHQGHQA